MFFSRKFSSKQDLLERFLSNVEGNIEIVSIPLTECQSEGQVRDIADRPLLRAALSARVDILLTGDKDFLEAGLKVPLVMTAAQFLDYIDLLSE